MNDLESQFNHTALHFILVTLSYIGFGTLLYTIWPPTPTFAVFVATAVCTGLGIISISLIFCRLMHIASLVPETPEEEPVVKEENQELSQRQQPLPKPAGAVRLENWTVVFDQPNMGPEGCGFRLQGQVFGDPAFADGTHIETSHLVYAVGKVAMVFREYWVILGQPSQQWISSHESFDAEAPLKKLSANYVFHYQNFQVIQSRGWVVPEECLSANSY